MLDAENLRHVSIPYVIVTVRPADDPAARPNDFVAFINAFVKFVSADICICAIEVSADAAWPVSASALVMFCWISAAVCCVTWASICAAICGQRASLVGS